MLKRFSNEQLEKLLLHTVGINNILVDVLLLQNEPEATTVNEPEIISDINFDIAVIEVSKNRQDPPFRLDMDLDALCGEWKGGRKRPDLLIFKAKQGYMIALGKKPKNGEVGDCFLIHEFRDNLCFNAGEGTIILSYDEEKGAITLFPGGEYTRIVELKK